MRGGSNQNRNLNCFNLRIEPSPAKLICYECEIFCWYETIRSSPGGPLDPSGQHGLTVRPLLSSDWSEGRPYWPVIGCVGVWRRAGTVLVSSSDVGEELGYTQLSDTRRTVQTSHTNISNVSLTKLHQTSPDRRQTDRRWLLD